MSVAILRSTLATVLIELERLQPASLIAARARGVLDATGSVGAVGGVKTVGRRSGWRKAATPDDFKIAAFYEQGLGAPEIASMVGKDRATVYAALKRCKVQMRKPGVRAKPSKSTAAKNERIERIKAARAEGLTLEQIGEREGVTRERIRQICVAAGIATPQPELTSEQLAAANRYVAGDSLDAAAASLGITILAMRRIIARCGYPIRPCKKQRRTMPETVHKAERAGQLYAAGKNTREIAEALGLNAPASVYRLLVIAGVKPNRHPRDSLKLTSAPVSA